MARCIFPGNDQSRPGHWELREGVCYTAPTVWPPSSPLEEPRVGRREMYSVFSLPGEEHDLLTYMKPHGTIVISEHYAPSLMRADGASVTEAPRARVKGVRINNDSHCSCGEAQRLIGKGG